MSIRGKLAIVVVMLLLPLGLMSGLFVLQSKKDIAFAEAELAGTGWLRQMWPSVMSWASAPDGDDEKILEAARSLMVPEYPASVRDAAGRLSLSGKATAEVGALFRDLATAAGNDSNLILDPDLDSFYVMDTVVVRLPDLITRAAELDMLARHQSTLKELDDTARAAFIVLLGQIETDRSTIEASVEVAKKSNLSGSVAAALDGPTAAFVDSVEAFSQTANKVAAELRNDEMRARADIAALSAANKALVGAADSYWRQSADQLDDLLEVRVGGFWARMSTMLGLALGIAILAIAAAVLLSRSIVRSISSLDAHIRELGDSDISTELVEAGRSDEVGQLARAVAYFRDRTIEKLNEANSEERQREILQNKRAALAGVADRLRVSVHSVVTAINGLAQNVSVVIDAVATNASTTRSELDVSLDRLDLTNKDMNGVVSAVTELAASLSEISQQTAVSAKDAETARTYSEAARALGTKLTQASERIGQVTTLISAIAQQTNLLALNATIEAARAGEAGKGFAVVASEVKQLANQTAGATDEITRQVEDIRAAAQEVASSLDEITGSIEAMSSLSTTIAGAVEQQSAATSEINESLDRSTTANHDVVASLNCLPTLASQTEQAAAKLADMSGTLVGQVQSLEHEVDALVHDLMDQRRHPRKQADVMVVVDFADGARRSLRLHDASRSGMRLAKVDGMRAGTDGRVVHPVLGPLDVKVVWCNDQVMGVQLIDRMLSDGEVDQLVVSRLAA
ncbi:methyl-accepting chemotaxis protein [Pleomorphomonas sp. JP5]|uniref:methyl-accepting chemotaxis protein n=1 Tax=Pleomorphomonas sp. JP5 TaxID=2942998 RepID=UPI002044CA5D|nr:methyl-accepting chemotaxis protein [Pleomorphomonas sp. JP5]MCM5559229.1 methyl-accepting chemotaxis protein [Pleomorphomonas sp. JP5]